MIFFSASHDDQLSHRATYLIQVTLDVIWIFRCHIFVLFVMADVWQLAGELVIIVMLHQK